MDFTLFVYKLLLTTLRGNGYVFQPFKNFLQAPAMKVVVLRHDIDKLPQNALKTAQLENELGIQGSYFFRVVSDSWDKEVMGRIAELGHELGYHYEDLAIAGGNYEKAIRHFERQLAGFRQIYPVKTICMHGSPLSTHDNRDLWKHYDYRDFGIIGEPYFDLDFNEMLYLTDTGRKWDGDKVSVRDKVSPRKSGFNNLIPEYEEPRSDVWSLKIRNTFDIIAAAEKGLLPEKMMINTHPQRWTNKPLPWLTELVWQNIKNVVKRGLLLIRGRV